jgi:serine acetyltransferase
VGNDVFILHVVTLGGTGKERAIVIPKCILEDSATVLGNISVGYGAIVKAKAIFNKSVPSVVSRQRS